MSVDPAHVSACLVTRGDQDLTEIYDSLRDAGVRDIVTWDNSKRRNLVCYGRFEAVKEARYQRIYFQDDDIVVPVAEIIAAYDPKADRHTIVANNREDEDWPLLGLGSVFHRSLIPGTFDPYIQAFGEDDDFYRIADVVFGMQHPYRKIVLGYRELAWSRDPNASMYLQPGHMQVRERARDRTLALCHP